MTITEVAKFFSNGKFDRVYDFIADDANWTVVEENHFTGKQSIIDNCNQVSGYFKSVTVDFRTLDVISAGNKVVITGTAEFIKDNKRISFVSACDLYEFDDDNQIQTITSYCIREQPK